MRTKNNNNATLSQVRVSINRRIEMPPAFLFPESDPPPSDLVPEHQSVSVGAEEQSKGSSGSGTTDSASSSSTSNTPADETDATAQLEKPPPLPPLPEEYTLPDLFPHSHSLNNKVNNNIADGGRENASKDYNDAYFANFNDQKNLSSALATGITANINAYHAANINNLSPRASNAAAGAETTHRPDEENNHVSIMSIQMGDGSPTNVESKMDLSPIQLESYGNFSVSHIHVTGISVFQCSEVLLCRNSK